MKDDFKDEYGSAAREKMKKSMEEPFTSYNRRQPTQEYHIASWVVGVVAVLFILGVIAAQLVIRYGHH